MTEDNRKKNSSRYDDRFDVLRGMQKKIIMRAALIVVTVLLTAVLLFSLTAAWYNNVAEMGGLTFTAAKWNFDGQIILGNGDETISMAPGDSGIVYMQIINQGEEVAAASVTVSKNAFDDMMKKRVYFYVDTSYCRNGERMDRVYVSANSGYAYTVFPGTEIVITEEKQNAPALKWEWVYDVLGYYVLATVTEEGEPQIAEYIRPIEYDYDSIFTTFYTETDADVLAEKAEAGQLKTIDGITTADEFIKEISKTDGYDGVYDISLSHKVNGYYPIYVNSEGYGVWAYLCTREEIEQHAKEDTALGKSEEYPLPSFSATVSVTGSNTRDTAFEVSDVNTFTSIVENSTYANVKLTSNITLTEQIDIKSGSRVYVDLNGYTIVSSTASAPVFSAEAYSKLTLVNGTVQGNGSNNVIEAVGAEIAISDVNIINAEEGIKICDHLNTANAETRIHVSNSKIICSEDAIWIKSLKDYSAPISIVVVNSTLEGTGYVGILGNGNRRHIDIQVTNSSVKGNYAAIYHPQSESTLTVLNSSLEGLTGLVVKGGTVNVIDSTVMGTGEYEDPTDTPSGFSVTGDGILLESSYTYGPATVNVSGDKTLVTSKNAYAVRRFTGSGTAELRINITGGKYLTEKRVADDDATVDMSCADVSEFVPDGHQQILTYGGYYMVTALEIKEQEQLASIIEKSVYANIKLAGDIELESTLNIKSDSSISIDLNGYAISYGGESIFTVEPSATLTLLNGELRGDTTNNAIVASGSGLALSGIEMIDVSVGIKTEDVPDRSGADANIHVSGSRITAKDRALLIDGSDARSGKISIIVENSVLVGESHVGISGSEARLNTDIHILNSEIKGGQTSIYHPQSGSALTVTSSSLEGATGIVVKGGAVNIVDSTVKGTGEKKEPADQPSGSYLTGDGILVETSSADTTVTVNVSGDKTYVTSKNADAVKLFTASDEASVDINITGGRYSTSVGDFVADGYSETETDGVWRVKSSS